MVILVLLALAAGFLLWRARGRRRLGMDGGRSSPGHARSGLEDIFRAPLGRVDDVRLAAVILMIQIVRTGSPITASEKTRILEFMEDPLQVEAISALFERAWPYTQARMPFARIADDLVPLLRRQLTPAERIDLIDMLGQIAGAHSPASELQSAAILALKGRLVGDAPAAVLRDARRAG